MKQTTFIYCLCEPGTKVIRYFGKSDKPVKRFSGHLSRARKGATGHRANLIRKLMKGGRLPDMHILCEVPSDDWERFERAFITLGRQYGFNLTNVMDGGQGPSPETCIKLSVAGFGRKHTEEEKLKISASNKGKKRTPEQVLTMRTRLTGRKLSAEDRAKRKGLQAGEKNPNFGKPAHPNVLSKLREKRPGAGSKFFGVSWCRATKKWKVQLSLGDSRLYLGCFSDELVAARTYDEAAKQYNIPSLKLNFPNGQ